MRVSARRTTAGHEITVQDNGDGFDPAKLTGGDSGHIGIWNVRERLERMCSGALEIESGNGGTMVIITLPIAKEDEEHAGDLRR